MPNTVENNFPPETNADAVYTKKNININNELTILSIFWSSLYLFPKNCGIVIALHASV